MLRLKAYLPEFARALVILISQEPDRRWELPELCARINQVAEARQRLVPKQVCHLARFIAPEYACLKTHTHAGITIYRFEKK